MIEIPWRPSDKDLRVFAVLQLVFFGVVAAIAWRRHAWPEAALVLVAASAVVAVVGLLLPRAIRPVYVGWMLAVFPIGWVVSHVVLAIVYYAVLWPIGAVLRLRGWDPLQRRRDPSATTYWRTRPEPPEPSRYYRQF